MTRPLPESEYGLPIRFRERGFMNTIHSLSRSGGSYST